MSDTKRAYVVYKKALELFLEGLHESVVEMLDNMDDQDNDKYAIHIIVDKNSVNVDMHAESYAKLVDFIKAEIKELG